MDPAWDERGTTADPAEAERRRRDHDLDVDSGAAPFDPGPGHYDDRRARRDAKKAEKEERRRRERETKARAAAEQAEARVRERHEAAARHRAELERRAAEGAEATDREHASGEETLRTKRRRAREAEAEKAARAHAERQRLQREERERVEAQRAERRRAKQAERDRRDAELRADRERVAAERAARDRAERERMSGRSSGRRIRTQATRPDGSARTKHSPARTGTAVAAKPAAKPKLKPSERLRLADLDLQPTRQPTRDPAPPRLTDKPAHVSLRLPTAKVGAALLVVAAVAALAGSAAGLPVPGLGDESSGQPADTGVDAAALALLDAGTPVGLSKGPYHPVVGGEIGYGERLAKFGAPRYGRLHEGQDVFAKPGTPLVSVRDGVVVDEAKENSQYSGGRGNYVVVYSQLDERSYVYLHLLKPALVKKGDTVEAGQPLGQIGCTGSCDGPHLHFEVRNGRQTLTAETKAVDPLPLLKQWPSVPVPGQG